MPNYEPSGASELPTPRIARDEAQLMLGQIQGVVWVAVNDAEKWFVMEPVGEDGEPGLTIDDLRKACAEVQSHFGTVHAALNTGVYDEELVRVGMTGAQGKAKKKGFLPVLGRFFGTSRQVIQEHVVRLRKSLRWSGTLIGSITAALKKEIERVPGAAAAGEAIREFIEVLLNATEPPETVRPTRGSQPRGGSGADTAT